MSRAKAVRYWGILHNLLRKLLCRQERENAFLQAVSGLKTHAEQGIAPAVEETKLGQARMHDALKQAELARNEQASLLQALQAQVSAVHKELSKSMVRLQVNFEVPRYIQVQAQNRNETVSCGYLTCPVPVPVIVTLPTETPVLVFRLQCCMVLSGMLQCLQEQNAAQKDEVSSLQEQLKQAQTELHAAKSTNTAAEQQRLFAEQQQWIAEQLKGISGAARPPVAPPSDAAPAQHFDDIAVPSAPDSPPDCGPAQHMSPQRSSQMFLSDEEPARIDAVYQSVGRLAETLRGDAASAQGAAQPQRHQPKAKGASRSKPDAATRKKLEKQSAGERKRKRSEKQQDESAHRVQPTADAGGEIAGVGDADASTAATSTSAGMRHAPIDISEEREVHDTQQPARKLRDRSRPSAAPAEPASNSAPEQEEHAPLARGRRRSIRAAAGGLPRRSLPRVAEDEDMQHDLQEMGLGCAMGPGGEHGSPPVPFGRVAAQAQIAPQAQGTAFEIWEDPASASPLPPTLRHDGAHVGLAPAMVNTSNQAARTQAAASAQDSRASVRKPRAAPRSQKDPSSFGIVRNPSAAITSKVLQAATASQQNFRSFSWADKLAAMASERCAPTLLNATNWLTRRFS